LISDYPKFLKKILLNPYFIYFKILFFPFILILKLFSLFNIKSEEEKQLENTENNEQEKKATKEEVVVDNKAMEMPVKFVNKISSAGFETTINIIHA
jgi:hypothetical protein